MTKLSRKVQFDYFGLLIFSHLRLSFLEGGGYRFNVPWVHVFVKVAGSDSNMVFKKSCLAISRVSSSMLRSRAQGPESGAIFITEVEPAKRKSRRIVLCYTPVLWIIWYYMEVTMQQQQLDSNPRYFIPPKPTPILHQRLSQYQNQGLKLIPQIQYLETYQLRLSLFNRYDISSMVSKMTWIQHSSNKTDFWQNCSRHSCEL